MKKLTLSILIAAVFAAPAFAGGDHKDKISSSFEALDNDSDGYISQEEADDDDIWEHFSKIDGISGGEKDNSISRMEYQAYMDMHAGEVAVDSEIANSAEDAEVKDLEPIENEFADLDDDADGYISLVEAEGHEIENHFGYMDKNSDKRVSKYEYNDYVAKVTMKHKNELDISKNQ
ncbi:EF-hand domain-containing protein [Aliiglaciecola lipolytica]|uniref:Calcium binding protein n=1 Tax=Aliiglaciecola lipolytica E3 TaxID=1127673 RepID=K6XYN3_9ALTE|nr:calcium-binding protein [Aliiglaciecola lipolytica]GAC16751.1 calcium binding protein [Aliiglaciecola lipolytica E3]